MSLGSYSHALLFVVFLISLISSNLLLLKTFARCNLFEDSDFMNKIDANDIILQSARTRNHPLAIT